MNKKIKIYFLGSGPIAVPVLTKLQHSPNLELLGVATQPDRQAGRKRQLLSTPVGTASDAAGIPALRVENVNDPDFLDMLKKLDVDFVLVVSFGQLLKADLLNLPRYGCINVHASILPRYRGASPISTAIANQDSETGVTFMKMDRGLDTGDIYQIITLPLTGTERCDALEQKLGELAAEHLEATLQNIASGALSPVPQDHTAASKTTKVSKDDGWIHWQNSCSEIEAIVRAYHPWPGARFFVRSADGKEHILTLLKAEIRSESGHPGEILQADKRTWRIACRTGSLEILEVLPNGRKPMSGPAFLNGCRLNAGSILTGGNPKDYQEC